MSDKIIMERDIWGGADRDQNVPVPVKVVDLNDGTHAYAYVDYTRVAKKVEVTDANTQTISARWFMGLSVVGIMASGNFKFYDGQTATGNPFIQLATTALTNLGNTTLATPIELTSGYLTIVPSALSTAKCWVLYR